MTITSSSLAYVKIRQRFLMSLCWFVASGEMFRVGIGFESGTLIGGDDTC